MPSVLPWWELYLFSITGALVLWIKMTVNKRRIHGLGDVLEHVFPKSDRAQYLGQFVVFVLLGGYVGYLLVDPFTQAQAVAGGVAWSRLAARD